MSHKKIILLLVGIASLLSSCTLPGMGEKADFTSLYTAHTKSQIASFRNAAEKLGYVGKYETKGSIRAFVDIPTIFSGAASALYDGVIEGYGLSQDSRVTFTNPFFRYETLLASGSLEAKEASFISRGGDMYIKYDGINGVEMIDSAMKEVFAKYNNVWLALTEKNLLETLSGSSEEDKFAFQMSQAIGKLKLDELEMYLTKYPLWKETGSQNTLQNGMIEFHVELHRENIIALINELSEKSTGKGLSEAARKNLEATLNEKQVSGTISYDAKNPKVSKTLLNIVSPDGSLMSVAFDENQGGWNLSTTASGSSISATMTEKGEGYSFTLIMDDNGTEVARLDANISFQGKKFRHLDAKISSKEEGLSLTFEQNMAVDGSFSGNLDAGMGNLTWNGKVGENFSLEAFHLKGAMIGSSLTLDLSPGTGSMLSGPLLLKSGEDVIVEAMVGLSLDKEHIHLSLDLANPETPEIRSHAEIRIEGKREKWNGSIEIPSVSTPFSELSEALRAIAPADTWTTDEFSGESLSTDAESYEYSISGSVIQ